MSTEEALSAVNLNTIEATPLRLHKFKRKQTEDEYTPRSKHIDKKTPQDSAEDKQEVNNVHGVITNVDKESTLSINTRANGTQPDSDGTAIIEERADVFTVPETRFDGSASIGSVLSQPDFSASVLRAAEKDDIPRQKESISESPRAQDLQETATSDDEHVVTSSRSSVRSASRDSFDDPSDQDTPVRASARPTITTSVSPTRTPRLRDFQMPLNTPRSIVDSALRAHQSLNNNNNNTASRPSTIKKPYPSFSEADLISFQTPAPRRQNESQSRLCHYTTAEGEEMLLDMTPRVYSPKSIPIYTLHDLDQIKADFDRSKSELEAKVQTLHEELASSVSHANHHKALAAQGESLHAEYSKKHVRKVTALKSDWERKTMERLAAQDAKLVEKEQVIVHLQAVLEQEREEKKEVIAMAEAVLALQQDG